MTVPETSGPPRRLWPADYYSTPTPESAFPRGLSYGCGAASLLVLAGIFVLGAVLASGGFVTFMDFAIGMSLGEMRGQFTAEVTAVQKKELEAEVERMRQAVRDEKVAVGSLQPFLQELRKASSDAKVTPAEAARLEEAARKVNQGARR